MNWSWRTQHNDIKEATSGYYRPGKYWENNLTQTISRTSWNHNFAPSVGSSFSLTTSASLGAIGLGNTDFLKNELKYSFVSPIWSDKGKDKLVFFVEGLVGYVSGLRSDTAISPVELYHMGGSGIGLYSIIPLRGYDDDVFGKYWSVEDAKSYTGGKMAAKFTSELRFNISMDPMPIVAYLFAEAGNLWRDVRHFNPNDLRRSAGVGVRLMIPQIGPLGFSYGYGFDNPSPITNNPNLKPSGWKFTFHLMY
jgi:outer membrane protein insertion porin family